MSRTTAQVSFLDEIIVDSFAGGGGATSWINWSVRKCWN